MHVPLTHAELEHVEVVSHAPFASQVRTPVPFAEHDFVPATQLPQQTDTWLLMQVEFTQAWVAPHCPFALHV